MTSTHRSYIHASVRECKADITAVLAWLQYLCHIRDHRNVSAWASTSFQHLSLWMIRKASHTLWHAWTYTHNVRTVCTVPSRRPRISSSWVVPGQRALPSHWMWLQMYGCRLISCQRLSRAGKAFGLMHSHDRCMMMSWGARACELAFALSSDLEHDAFLNFKACCSFVYVKTRMYSVGVCVVGNCKLRR